MRKIVVELYNRVAVLKKPYPVEELREVLSYVRPGYFYSKQGDWDTGKKYLLSRDKIGTGLFLAMKDELERTVAVRFDIRDRRSQCHYKSDTVISNRPFQNECLAAMMKSISGGLILSATGTGKTVVAGMYFRRLKGFGLFVVDELLLMDQSMNELKYVLGEKIGIIGNGKFDPRRITVATVQTLHRQRNNPKFEKWYRGLDAMLIDEIHVQLNRRNIDVVKQIKPKVVFGLTATLELKKKHVRMQALALSGPPIFEYPLDTGVQEGYLTPGVVISVEVDQEGMDQDYQTEYVEMIVRSKKRNRAICSIAREAYDQGRSTIILVERVKHLKKLSRKLKDIPHRTVFGEKRVEDRIIAKEKFDKGKIRLLIANKVFKKGISINAIDTIIECAALRSKNDVKQKYGRGIRLGKEGLLYFDISDRTPKNYSTDGWETYNQSENRFSKCTTSRLNALRQVGIKIVKASWNNNPDELFELGNKTLKKEISKLKKGKVS